METPKTINKMGTFSCMSSDTLSLQGRPVQQGTEIRGGGKIPKNEKPTEMSSWRVTLMGETEPFHTQRQQGSVGRSFCPASSSQRKHTKFILIRNAQPIGQAYY